MAKRPYIYSMRYKKGYYWKSVNLKDLKGEVWKDIKGWEGEYRVSNFCRIKSLKRRVDFITEKGIRRFLTTPETILKPTLNGGGYPTVKLYRNSFYQGMLVHRASSIEFIPNPENKSDINHKNGIRDYMELDNFEWVTRGENHEHKYRVLKVVHPFLGRTGIRHACSVKTCQVDINTGETIKVWDAMNDIQRSLGFEQANISACCRGKQKTAYGYKWKYYVNRTEKINS